MRPAPGSNKPSPRAPGAAAAGAAGLAGSPKKAGVSSTNICCVHFAWTYVFFQAVEVANAQYLCNLAPWIGTCI